MNNQILKTKLESEFEFIKDLDDDDFEIYVDIKNILKWYFLIKGQIGTDYAGGYYLGEISFLDQKHIEYPTCEMFTPTGHFITHQKLDIFFSPFHYDPEEVSEILYDILSMFSYDQNPWLISSNKKHFAFSSITFNKLYYPELIKKFQKFLDHNGNSPEHNQNIYIFWLNKCAVIDNLDLDVVNYLSKLFFYNI